MSEHSEQVAFVQWLTLMNIKHYAIPNAGKRSPSTAAWFICEGMSKGVPDICIPVPTKAAHGLYIEMKFGKNKTTKEQDEWLAYLSSVGYSTAVCYSAEAAIKVTQHYLREGKYGTP